MKGSSSHHRGSDQAYTIDDWILHETIPFSLDSPEALKAAIDMVIASLGGSVELLGLGEALHGGEDILVLRNRLFKRLVEAHGYTAIAIESSFPRGRLLKEYISGLGPSSYDSVQEAGFSHGFGRLDANRELLEWMKAYNADSSHGKKIQFYGFDSPTEMTSSDSPSRVLHFVIDYLASIDSESAREHRERIDPLLGHDSDWEDPAATLDPARSIGLSPSAAALRTETEDLIAELQVRRPDLVASDEGRYLEAVQHARVARQLLNYHAAVARDFGDPARRIVRLLGMRDAMMADNLAYIVSRERCRGKVLAFAHNSHLKRGEAEWKLGEGWTVGTDVLKWWPAGAHLDTVLGRCYEVIGTGIGSSEASGIGQPEAGTLEALLTSRPGPARFIPTHRGQGIPASEAAALPIRSGSTKNQSYFALTPESLADFDWLAILDSTSYSRGGPTLQP